MGKARPYAQLSKADNELLIRTGPGTPMGDLYRRFWAPVMLAEELGGPDSAPVRVNVLGENLVAFRNSSGKLGLIDAYCPHRRANLYWGRNEQDGLRCVYHGWKFDVNGQCTDLPNCPEGEVLKNKVRTTAYPVLERGGIIWAYMGPADKDSAVSRCRSLSRAALASASDQGEAARQLRADARRRRRFEPRVVLAQFGRRFGIARRAREPEYLRR